MTVEERAKPSDGSTAEQSVDSVDTAPSQDAVSLRADIAATRSALGNTVEELADRVNPVAQTKRMARRFHDAGSRRMRQVRSGWGRDGDVSRVVTALLVAGAAVAAGMAGWGLVRAWRRR